MPKVAKPLGAIQIARLASQQGLHAVGGAPGLQLQVRGDAASWVLRVMIGGKRRDIGLGGYPAVPLAAARDKARDMRSKIAEGMDPLAERRSAKARLIGALTFDQASTQFIEFKSAEWKNAKHRDQWTATLQTYASPVMGAMPVDQIQLEHVEAVLRPIWSTKTETATRVRGRIEAVLDWATVGKLRTGDNPARWKGNLKHRLAMPGKVRKVKHHAALDLDAMPGFMVALRTKEGMGARALELAILTAARSIEIRGATWSEFDLEKATWTVPGKRMKAGKEHKVPLSPPALRLLRALPRFSGTDLVFPNAAGDMLSENTLATVLKRMHIDAVPHGFRSTFRDWASERSNYPHNVAEMALAHTIGDKVEKAYRRGDLFTKRTKMMADWARFIDTMPAAGNVINLPARAG